MVALCGAPLAMTRGLVWLTPSCTMHTCIMSAVQEDIQMIKLPSFFSTLSVGLCLEAGRLKRSPLVWILVGCAWAGGLLMGLNATGGWEPVFGPLKLAL